MYSLFLQLILRTCVAYVCLALYITEIVDLFSFVEREVDLSSDKHDATKYDPPPAKRATHVKRPHFHVPNGHPTYPPIDFIILSANMKVILTHSIVLSQHFYYFFTACLGSCDNQPITHITFTDVLLATLRVLRRIKKPPDRLWNFS